MNSFCIWLEIVILTIGSLVSLPVIKSIPLKTGPFCIWRSEALAEMKAFKNRSKICAPKCVALLRKFAKMRKEAIDMYQKGGADDRAAAEQAELDLVSQWLPSLADEDQTRAWVQEAITAAGEPVNIGKVMGALMKAHKGEVDGALAQKVVKEEVGKLS